jgi:transcriptional regulator with XRE-family HTH domain
MTKQARRHFRAPAMGAFGEKLRSSRLRAQMTVAEVGQLVGVSGSTVGNWEQGRQTPAPRALDELANVFGWDDQPRQEPPRTEPPVAASSALRIAMSKAEDELSFSMTKYRHAVNYIATNTQELVDRYERLMRELHALEQNQGVTSEQLAVLRDKARKYDQFLELAGRKLM